jgi:hypothetical protein
VVYKWLLHLKLSVRAISFSFETIILLSNPTIMKKLLFLNIAILFFACSPALAQLLPRLLPGNGAFGNTLEKIVKDLPNNFQNLKGELLSENPQSADYHSLVSLPGAQSCMVTTHHSKKRAAASWTAIMYQGETFAAASKQYNQLFNKIKGCSIKGFAGGKNYTLKGAYDKPDEARKFAATLFELTPDDITAHKLKVELTMEYVLLEWQVKIMVYDKDDDDKPTTE